MSKFVVLGRVRLGLGLVVGLRLGLELGVGLGLGLGAGAGYEPELGLGYNVVEHTKRDTHTLPLGKAGEREKL